ncbi:hypothetical protein ES703_121161 [subsurface metagenome]
MEVLLERIEDAGDIDGIYLALHGAMLAGTTDDGTIADNCPLCSFYRGLDAIQAFVKEAKARTAKHRPRVT